MERGRYRFVEQRRYPDALLEALDVRERVTLVIHDWGSALGFDWANRHRKAVIGIAFMEAIEGEPADVNAIAKAYAEWVATSDVPKLFIKAEPGATLMAIAGCCRNAATATGDTVWKHPRGIPSEMARHSSESYVVSEALKLVFRKDAEFEDWLLQHHNNETSAKSVEESLFATTRKS
jgi:pimeloyl-ACP methyl ester carboxylesterase